MSEDEKPKKKKVKKNLLIDDDPLSADELKPKKKKKTTKKKSKKKKKVKTEIKDDYPEQDEEDEQEEIPKPKKKTKKKKKKIISNNSSEEDNKFAKTDIIKKSDYENENDSEEQEKPKSKKKKKKTKKIKINNSDDESNEDNNSKSNKINNKNNKNKLNNNYINSENESQNEKKEKKVKKVKKGIAALNNRINNKKIDSDKENEENNNTKSYKDNEYKYPDNNSKTNEDNFDNKSDLKSNKEEEEIKEEKISGKKIDINNNSNKKPLSSLVRVSTKSKKDMDMTKSAILNLFSTKTLKKQNSDYEESKDNDDKQINSPFEGIKEENSLIDENYSEGSFANLISKINNLDYQGYNYNINEKDYFQRIPDEPPIKTILNSEDAAIKKCEELMDQLEDKLKWEDPDFGPQPNDNGIGNRKAIYGEYGNAQNLGFDINNVSWYGIKEINENATFFYDGTESNDVLQGALGDCWFISALSVIATKDYLLRGEFNKAILEDGKIDEEEIKMMSEGIYPPIFHSFSTKGIYCFRFYKNFKWRYVLIDDRLPCYSVYNENQTKKPIFAHCRLSNEFWVPLIEKAYAKLHGSYSAIVSGFIDDGLVDMTGLVSKKMIKENLVGKSEELWALLKERSKLEFEGEMKTQAGKTVTAKIYKRNKSMMGCSVELTGKNKEAEVSMQGHKIGIIAGHAYSILDVFEIPKARSKKPRKTSRLLRIRNPWGNYEWNGKWCDNSEEVIKNKERIEKVLNEKYKDTNEKIDFSQDDGAFLMRFSDIRKIFNNIFFCQNFPPSYIGVRFYDKWTKNSSGGLPIGNTEREFRDFFLNPQYFFEIKKPGKVIICLLQNDGRLYGEKYPFQKYVKKVCLIVFKANNESPIDSFDNHIDQTVIAQRREICLELNLQAGKYIAIPSLKDKNDYTSFNLEFYFEDELLYNTKNNQFDFKQLKYTKIKKLGDNPKCELINEYIASEVQMASKNKLDFIISEFQYSLKREEENKKNEEKIKKFYLKGESDDEDF